MQLTDHWACGTRRGDGHRRERDDRARDIGLTREEGSEAALALSSRLRRGGREGSESDREADGGGQPVLSEHFGRRSEEKS